MSAPNKQETKHKSNLPHEAVLLSKIISERLTIQVTFLDGEVMHDGVKWHTPYHIGLKGGKVVNKASIKYWEVEKSE